eukprot:g15089.t1
MPWEELTTSETKPSARYGHSVVVYGRKMVVFGGDGPSRNNDVWTLDRISFEWNLTTTLGTKPTGRYGHSSNVHNGKMVVFGGNDGSANNDVWTLDLSSYMWKLITTSGTKPNGRYQHSSVVYGGKLVIYGGRPGSFQTYDNGVWTLDLSSYEWEKVATGNRKDAHSAVIYDGKMIIFGGYYFAYLGSVSTMDLSSYEWKQITTSGTSPSARNKHSAIVFNKKLVVFGGWDKDGIKNDVWTLDLNSYEWKLITTSGAKPAGRFQHFSIVSNGKMVIFGGRLQSSRTNDLWTLTLICAIGHYCPDLSNVTNTLPCSLGTFNNLTNQSQYVTTVKKESIRQTKTASHVPGPGRTLAFLASFAITFTMMLGLVLKTVEDAQAYSMFFAILLIGVNCTVALYTLKLIVITVCGNVCARKKADKTVVVPSDTITQRVKHFLAEMEKEDLRFLSKQQIVDFLKMSQQERDVYAARGDIPKFLMSLFRLIETKMKSMESEERNSGKTSKVLRLLSSSGEKHNIEQLKTIRKEYGAQSKAYKNALTSLDK